MAEATLKPCPLCEADMNVKYEETGPYWTHPGRHGVQQTDCALRDSIVIDEPDEIDEWNNRTWRAKRAVF